MKCKIYPNYTQEYQKVSETSIKLTRKVGHETVYTNYINFDTPEECEDHWQNHCGA